MNAIQKYAFSLLSKEAVMEEFGLVEAEVKEEAAQEKFGEARLEGDDDVFIYFPGDELTVGSPVFSDDSGEEPLADGEYNLDGGAMITVADGMVSEISEAGEEEEAPAEEEDAKKEEEELATADFDAFEAFTALSDTVNDLMEKFNTLVEQIETNNKKVETLSKASAATYKPNAKTATREVATENFKNLTGADKLKALRNKK